MTEHDHNFQRGEEFLEQEKYLQAIQIFHSLIDVPQFSRKSVIKLIEIYDAQNQIDAAIKLFRKFLAEQPDDENIKAFYAQFLIRKKKYSDAHDVLSQISTKNHPEKNFLMGMVNYYLADYDISRINFEEFIRQNKDSELLPDAYLYVGKCYLYIHKLDSALENFKKSEEFTNQNYEIYLNLSIVYYLKEMYLHALQSINKSIKLNPSEVENYEWSGKIYFKQGDYKKAKKELETAIELKDPDSELYALLGLTCYKINDYNSARNYFQLALKLNPANEVALSGLADIK